MSDKAVETPETESAAHERSEEGRLSKKRSIPRRFGCTLILAAWFLILLMPCGLFYLATNGEIRLEHSDIPQPHAHPLLLISLISEKDERGFRIESSTLEAGQGDAALCIETLVRFLLWASTGGDQNTRFCDCYQQADTVEDWELAETFSHACPYSD